MAQKNRFGCGIRRSKKANPRLWVLVRNGNLIDTNLINITDLI